MKKVKKASVVFIDNKTSAASEKGKTPSFLIALRSDFPFLHKYTLFAVTIVTIKVKYINSFEGDFAIFGISWDIKIIKLDLKSQHKM